MKGVLEDIDFTENKQRKECNVGTKSVGFIQSRMWIFFQNADMENIQSLLANI